MPILIFIVLAIAAFAAGELLTAPARERRRVLERATGYGEPQSPQRRERATARQTARVLPATASALARVSLRVNKRLSLDVARDRLIVAGLARRLSPTSFLALKGLSAGGGALLGIMFGAAFGKPLAAFVRAVNQADQLGMSIGRILRVQASEARAHRQAAAEEWAMKTPVKMLFPTVIFFFPALFTVLLGPAIMNFGHML